MSYINDYVPQEYNTVFDCPDGDHKIRIKEAKEEVSKTGKKMIAITYLVQGSNSVPFVDRIIEGDYFNVNITRFFDAFRIDRGQFNMNLWIGKEAMAHFEHRVSEYTDKNGQVKTSNKSEMTRLYTPDSAPQNNVPQNVPQSAPRAASPVQNNAQKDPWDIY